MPEELHAEPVEENKEDGDRNGDWYEHTVVTVLLDPVQRLVPGEWHVIRGHKGIHTHREAHHRTKEQQIPPQIRRVGFLVRYQRRESAGMVWGIGCLLRP